MQRIFKKDLSDYFHQKRIPYLRDFQRIIGDRVNIATGSSLSDKLIELVIGLSNSSWSFFKSL